MRIGAELGYEWLQDVGALREAVQRLEAAGFDFVAAGSHVITEAPGLYPDLPDYAYAYPYRDLLTLFTHLASVTTRLAFRTDLLILPLYPTAVIARQCADISDITGGRLELGVGVGWNEVEYRALGQDVHARAARYEEQLEVLRALWTTPRITYHGAHHDLEDVGLGAPPAAPIPLRMACAPHERLMRRVARLGDGWIPNVDPVPHVETMRSYVRDAGRPQDAVQITGRLGYGAGIRPGGSEDREDPAAWAAEAQRYRESGVDDAVIWAPARSEIEEGVAALIAARDAVTPARVGSLSADSSPQ